MMRAARWMGGTLAVAVALVAITACGSGGTSPNGRRSLHLLTVDGRSIPVELFANEQTKAYGWVLDGSLLAPASTAKPCDASLSLNRSPSHPADSTFTQPETTSCDWTDDSTKATALIDIGGSWGTHTYGFGQ